MADPGRLKIYEGGQWRYAGFGISGYSGLGLSGYSGYSGYSGFSGYSGISGYSGGGGLGYAITFVDSDLVAGILTVNHNLAQQYNVVEVINGLNNAMTPDDITFQDANTTIIDLTSFGTLVGTWAVVITSGNGTSGYSGYSSTFPGTSGYSGYSGYSSTAPGISGYSGYSGYSGISGYSSPAGSVVQVSNYQTGAWTTGTNPIPYDDTVPQISEGDPYMSIAFTPTSATNNLKIDVCFFGTNNSNGGLIVALFQDSGPNALATGVEEEDGAGQQHGVTFTHFMVAGTTSSTTFKVRAGSISGTTSMNGNDSGGFFGGSMPSSITVTEIGV